MMLTKLTPTAKIKTLMWSKGITAADVARLLGMSRQCVGYTIRGKRKGAKVRNFLSQELNLPADFWTEMDRWRKTEGNTKKKKAA